MKYARTKNGIFEVIVEYLEGETKQHPMFIYWRLKNGDRIGFVKTHDELNNQLDNISKEQADTIEELIRDDDLLYIYDLYPDAVLVVEGNIRPFGYPKAIKLKDWLNYDFVEFDLYIKLENGDYRKVAHRKPYEKLKLLEKKD